ncbi:DUF3784 domain-containing protein [Alkalibacterium putridalgicola]|uniref:DUF3784 domain-containing protein n=1 Tax=Alkalibacterium putridalgicola TaxID=426703 RepID=UPI0034CFFB1B
MLTYLFMGIVLLAIGFAVHVLKWNILIAYYNTKPNAKKNNKNTESYRKILGYYGYITGGIFLLLALLEYMGISVPPTPVTAIFIVWTMIVMYFAQKDDEDEK